MAWWKTNIENSVNIFKLKREYGEVMAMEKELRSDEGFEVYSDDKKSRTKISLKKDPVLKKVAMKFQVGNIKVPLFNLLAMIYEIDLYDLWFPFCHQSFCVSKPSF